MIRSFVIALMLALVLALPAAAGELEKGMAAYERGDYATARTVFLPLARRGDPTAQSALGVIYHYGLGVEADLATAIKWYAKAANGGDPLAQRKLGDLHAEGVAGAPDYAAAAAWYEAAAAGGDKQARQKLHALYRDGRVARPRGKAGGGDPIGAEGEAVPTPRHTQSALARPPASRRAMRAGRKRLPGKRPSSCMSGMADAPYHIDVKIQFPEIHFDHTRSVAQLGKIFGASHKQRVLGLMKPDLRLRTRPRSEAMTSGGQFCFWISGFEVVLRYHQVNVYVAKEYPEGSCPYNAVLEHEMQHVAVARRNLEEFAPRIREALELGTVPTAQTPIIVASAADAARDVKEISRENLAPVYRSMLLALRMAQSKVDSPQSYARVFAKCSDW